MAASILILPCFQRQCGLKCYVQVNYGKCFIELILNLLSNKLCCEIMSQLCKNKKKENIFHFYTTDLLYKMWRLTAGVARDVFKKKNNSDCKHSLRESS